MMMVKKIMICLLFIIGVFILTYPTISNYIAIQNFEKATVNYNNIVHGYSKEKIAEEWKKATIYNDSLRGSPVRDPFVPGSGYAVPSNYKDVLNIGGDDIMGYLEIDKIDVKIPIYHGTSDEQLRKGIGHIAETPFPIGGSSNHAMLTGHRGYPGAKLFTDLDQLDVGDIFKVYVLDKVYGYQVDQIKVIEPDKINNYSSDKGKDYVSLITCTPYGINSHRLIVRGERIEIENNEKKEQVTHYYFLYIILTISFLAISIFIYIVFRKKKI